MDWQDPWSEVGVNGDRYDTPPDSYSTQEKAWCNYVYSECRAYGKTPRVSSILASSYVNSCRSVGEENVIVGDPLGIAWGVLRLIVGRLGVRFVANYNSFYFNLMVSIG